MNERPVFLKSKAAVLHRPGASRPYVDSKPLKIEEVDLLPPRPGEVLIRVAGAGVCHSDLAAIEGVRRIPMPLVVGHECSGVVEQLGRGVKSVEVGDHVVVSFVPSCGTCMQCASGVPALCDLGRASNRNGVLPEGGTRFRLEGKKKEAYHHLGVSAFSERTVVSERSLIRVTEDIPIVKAALFGCAIVTGIGSVVNTAQVRAGRSVAVFGCGGVGLNVIQGAKLVGASQIIAVDTVDSKLKLAKSFGATDTVNASRSDAVEAVRKLSGGRGVDYAFEAIGNTSVMAQAFQTTAKRGKTIVIGVTSADDRLSVPSSMIMDEERTIVGSYMGSVVPRRDVPLLVDLYLSGRIKVDELVSRYIRLEDVNEGVEALAKGKVARQIIDLT